MASDVVSNLGKWMWYLVPSNPILQRVVHGGSRRVRHLWYRFAYLLVLFLVFIVLFLNQNMDGSLAEVAKTASQIFRGVATTQLLLMCFLAPVFTAGAITQEKDAETFNILLTTPLSNAQIIFGSLLSRLYFVIVLLLSGLPIFCITMIYGGVTTSQIITSFAIAGGTAIVTGSLAIMISMLKVGTRRTIFSFYLVIGIYLFAVFVLGKLAMFQVPEAPTAPGSIQRMSYLAPFHPFLALDVAMSRTPAPLPADVAHYGWPISYLVASPQVSYVLITMLLSLLMIVISMLFVRSGAKEGEITFFSRITGAFKRNANRDQLRRKPNRVWSNPVAWREARTRASAASSSFMRYVLMLCGVLLSVLLLYYVIAAPQVTWEQNTVAFGPVQARYYLSLLVALEFSLILLVVTNASATSMTKERESNTMDILMTTPLTSKYIIWGKLRGLMSYTMPMLAVPIASMLLFVGYDVIRMIGDKPALNVVNIEAVVELALMFLVYASLTCIIGLQTSLKSKKTVKAVLVTVTIMTIICGLSYIIGDAIVSNSGNVGAAIAPITPYTSIGIFTYPDQYALTGNSASIRIFILIGTCVSLVFYTLVVGGMYKSLVHNFDMIVRKQTAS